MATLIAFDQRRPDTALDRLNRRTGLDFRDWPESLLDQRAGDRAETEPQAYDVPSRVRAGRR